MDVVQKILSNKNIHEGYAVVYTPGVHPSGILSTPIGTPNQIGLSGLQMKLGDRFDDVQYY